MRQTKFDTRLIQILSAMAALALMVGVVAIAVNRYLVQSHTELIQNNLPAMELASQIGASAEVVGTLAVAFVQADSGDDVDRIASALTRAVDHIESGAQTLEGMSTVPQTPVFGLRGGQIVARMIANAHERLRLADRIAADAADVALHGEQLAVLIEAQTDLARLRITAGIVDLYQGGQTDPRPALDTLADTHFFAFERVTELARMVDAVRLQLQQIPELAAPQMIEAARAKLADRLAVAERRVNFLPSATAQDEANILLQRHRTAIAPGGLIDLQADRLALRSAIEADSDLLRQAILSLSQQARAARDAIQADGLAQIAAAETRASRLTLGLLAVVIVAVVAGLVLWLYARRQLVARLANVSGRIVAVAGGQYGDPMAISGHDEIGRMEKALNILRRRTREAARLRAHLEEAVIARTGDVVAEMKISDAARADAEAANQSKSEFLARMSHEIRTPLNGIIGMLGLLQDDATDAHWRGRVKTAHASARELVDITNDILTYASSQDRTDGGNPVHFMLREFVGQLGHQLQSLAAQKRLNAIVDLAEPAPPVLLGDITKIRQVVGNLISNAVKYTERGTVTLIVDYAVSDDTNQPVVSFTVSDTGIGMSREAVARAFDAYSRADTARRAGIEGLGLGLAISRRLTRALGGALTVESEPGVGSRFTLTVPLIAGDAELIPKNDARWPEVASGHKVLVIDDHTVNRMVARGYLERMGCRVAEAATGTAGVEAENAERFDLVLIDLDLPDMRGEEVAARISAKQNFPMLVALTAHLIDDTHESRARLGVARVLSKPISPRALAEVLALATEANLAHDAEAVLDSLREDISDLGAGTTALIVREFLQSLPDELDTIRAAPLDQQRKAAHRLKGAASNFRLRRLCETLAQIEAGADGVDAELIQRALQVAQDAAEMLEVAAATAGLQIDAGSTKR